MANFWYKMLAGVTQPPMTTDINQLVDAFNGAFDVGAVKLFSQISAPSTAGITAAIQAGSALGVGTYRYKITYVTGYVKSNNQIIYGSETPGSTSISVTTTTGNTNVYLNGLPTTLPTGVVAIRIYRTAVGGADGTQKLVATLTAPPSANFTDSTADVSLGAAIPTVNTTGSYFSMPTISQATILPVNSLAIVNGLLSLSNGSVWTPVGSSPLTNPLTYV